MAHATTIVIYMYTNALNWTENCFYPPAVHAGIHHRIGWEEHQETIGNNPGEIHCENKFIEQDKKLFPLNGVMEYCTQAIPIVLPRLLW